MWLRSAVQRYGTWSKPNCVGFFFLYVCSGPESVRPERHSDGSDLQDERPGGTEADGGVELLLPRGTPAERGRRRKGKRRGEPGLRSRRSRGRGGHRRYGRSQHVCWIQTNCVSSGSIYSFTETNVAYLALRLLPSFQDEKQQLEHIRLPRCCLVFLLRSHFLTGINKEKWSSYSPGWHY